MDAMKDKDNMNDGVPRRRTGRPRLPWAGALAAVAGTALLVAACGGSSAGADTFAPGATYAQTLAFAKCMRANGVPNFPNPDRQGNFNDANPEVQAMYDNGVPPQGGTRTVSPQRNVLFECRSVLPNAGTGLTLEQMQQISQQNLREEVDGARCMRAHGITNFPDPVAAEQDNTSSWPSAIRADVDTSTPSYEAALTACNRSKLVAGIIPPPGFDQVPGLPPGSPPPVSGNGS
jgi:hypothetical protein